MDEKYLELVNVTVKTGGNLVLHQISFTIRQGEQWVIAGPSGSGKTVLANTIAGRNFYSGKIDFHFPERRNHKSTIVLVDQQHRFKNIYNTTDLYYQQRFNSYDAEQTITVRQEIQEQFQNNGLLDSEWLDLLHIRSLLDEPLIQLSNGENKRVQLVIALLENPELLILDNPFIGLDTEGRNTLQQIIELISRKGILVLLITANRDIPAYCTHLAWLDKGQLLYAGKKEHFPGHHSVQADKGLDAKLFTILKPVAMLAYDFAIKMVNVNIHYGDKKILQNINWEVRKGECWNLSGPNGAGKSTLLSLITADNPQAYANEIYLFDRKRGTGESIWDIKKNIGFVSPELHLYFDFSVNCHDVIASGLFDTIGLFRQLDQHQLEKISIWMKLFDLDHLRFKRMSQLSLSEQRRTLLARALIKNPPLLILDEPCQGLDDEQTAYFKNLIHEICIAFETTLIYVSHYTNQIPACVSHYLHLENGRVIQCGKGSF